MFRAIRTVEGYITFFPHDEFHSNNFLSVLQKIKNDQKIMGMKPDTPDR
jgi:hypothetical protein